MFHWYGYIYTPDRKVTVCFIGMVISIPIIIVLKSSIQIESFFFS